MNINYPVGDFLIRLKNARMAKLKVVTVPSTKLIKATADALAAAGFLRDVTLTDGVLEVGLIYKKKEPVIMDVKLVSKPGLRIYMNVDELEKRRKPSILVLSTPKGVMSSKKALKERVGGEVIAEVL
jgi:small subunit ribosomal protein S8